MISLYARCHAIPCGSRNATILWRSQSTSFLWIPWVTGPKSLRLKRLTHGNKGTDNLIYYEVSKCGKKRDLLELREEKQNRKNEPLGPIVCLYAGISTPSPSPPLPPFLIGRTLRYVQQNFTIFKINLLVGHKVTLSSRSKMKTYSPDHKVTHSF